MNSYPMQYEKVSFEHMGGTKAYILLKIVSDHGAILIKRWGRIGALSQLKVEPYTTAGQAERAFVTARDERTSGRKGYRITDRKIDQITAPAELRAVIGRAVFPKIGAPAINQIDPDYDTTGFRQPEDPTYDEDGNYLGPNKPRTIVITAEMKAQAEAEKREQIAAGVKQHPLYGRF